MKWLLVLAGILLLLGAALVAGRPPMLAGMPTVGRPERVDRISPAAFVSAPVKAAERTTDHSELFDVINFIILIVVLVYFLRKPLRQFFVNRSTEVKKGLEEGRAALDSARDELQKAEARLSRIQVDIEEFKTAAAREWEAEIERLRRASDDERERILASACQMIESATEAARLELKRTAANEAVANAAHMIEERLDDAGRARLVSRFLSSVSGGDNGRQRPV